MTQKNPRSFKVLMLALLVIIVAAGATYALVQQHHKAVTPSAAKTTSTAKTAQANYRDGDKRATSDQNSVSQGGAIDQKGSTPQTNSDQSSWSTSTSGVVTLKQPTKNSLLTSGDTFYGSAAVDTVQYRLVDDVNGVIAQGSLAVVDGSYSGKLQFKAYSTTGTFKVFSFDPQSGAEINGVKIAVKLKP